MCKKTGKIVAIREINLEKKNEKRLQDCLREVEILSQMDHPHIIKV